MDDLVTAHVESLIATVAEQQIRIEALEAALHDAFMAMCSYRDTPDDEVFQDAIDALGAASRKDAANVR